MKIGLMPEEGREEILGRMGVMPEEWVLTEKANGRILSKNLTSPENIPPFRRAPLDGYAFSYKDTLTAREDAPVVLRIIEEIPAGKAPVHVLRSGECVKILTGAPLPEGADVVEKFEVVEASEHHLTLKRAYRENENVVPVGEEICQGDALFMKGSVLSPAYLGILAGLGFTKVPVYKKPVVCLISTGSELVSIDTKPLPMAKIRNSSIYTLKAFLEKEGMETILMPIVKDDVEEISKTIKAAYEKADVIMTTGGVSVGDYDLLMKSMDHLGAEKIFWRLLMKPGMAFLFSVFSGKPVVSLSGNPSSAVMAMLISVLPGLRKLCGRSDFMLEECQVKLLDGCPKKNRARRFVAGRLVIKDGQACMASSRKQSNGILHPLHN